MCNFRIITGIHNHNENDYTPPTTHTHTPNVILGLMISGSFFMSANAASGRPQFATTGRDIQQFTATLYMVIWLARTYSHSMHSPGPQKCWVGTNT